MACQGQMHSIYLFITISIYVVTSQVHSDVFGTPQFDEACYGPTVLSCTHNSAHCENNKQVLISDIAYKKSTGGKCAGVNNCKHFENMNKPCCKNEEDVTLENDTIGQYRLHAYKECSGERTCEVNVPLIQLSNGLLTAITIKYHCINNEDIMTYCENITKTKDIVHIMYNGRQDKYVNRNCYCKIHSESGIDLYSVDIRLHNQDSTHPYCTKATLKWENNQKEYMEQCIRFGDHSTLRNLNLIKTKEMWVQLNIKDTVPTMVWIAAKAKSGNVDVTCGEGHVNTQSTTSTFSASSENTTINMTTQSIPSVSKSDPGSTTVMISSMSTTVAISVQLYEPSSHTTVASLSRKTTTDKVNVTYGQNEDTQVSDDDTDIGPIVGPVIGIVIIVIFVVIGLIVLRRRRAKQQSSQTTTTRAYENKASAYDIISDYDTSKPIALPTGSKVANGEPVDISSSFDDRYTQGDENAISDVVNDMYSDINPKDMVSDDPRRNDNSESDYNHLHGLKACETDEQSGNVNSHLKTSLRNTSPRNDDYDHFGCNKPNTLKDNNVSSLSSNDYDHLSSAKTNNITDCNQPITTHIQQATTTDATVKTSDNSNTPEGFCTDTTSQQIEPSCEYAKVKRDKPVAASDYEMAGILNDVEV